MNTLISTSKRLYLIPNPPSNGETLTFDYKSKMSSGKHFDFNFEFPFCKKVAKVLGDYLKGLHLL